MLMKYDMIKKVKTLEDHKKMVLLLVLVSHHLIKNKQILTRQIHTTH